MKNSDDEYVIIQFKHLIEHKRATLETITRCRIWVASASIRETIQNRKRIHTLFVL